MKKTILYIGLLVAGMTLMSFIQVLPNGDVSISSDLVKMYFSKVGRMQQALDWNFNPARPDATGFGIEQGQVESSGIYFDQDYAVIWSPGDQDRILRFYDEDNMSTGSTNYEVAFIDGDGDYYKASDLRRKEEIQPVTDAVEKLKKINGVNYKYKHVEDAHKMKAKKTCGLIAQDVQAVIPEAVSEDMHGNKFMNYDAMIPYLVEAVKAQQTEIEFLKAELAKTKK